jgi:hypothetical protein
MLKNYKMSNLSKGTDLEHNTLRDQVKNQFLTLEAWRSKNSQWRGGRGFPWRRRTLGRRLARPREVRSLEKEVLEWWMSVRVREKESKEEDNGQGFKYPWTRVQPNIVQPRRTLSR